GTLTFSGALFLLVLALIRGNAECCGGPLIVGLLTGSVLLLALFLVSQFVQNESMFDLRLFRKPTFDGASIVAFTLAAALFAMFLYLVLYIQTLLGYSPLQTGLRFLPFTLVAFLVALPPGRLLNKVPMKLLIAAGMPIT